MTRILVDGDGCAGRYIIEEIAKIYSLELRIYCSYAHEIKSSYGSVIKADSDYQAVDMMLINEAKAGDIVVTQDFGVAALALGKGAGALSPKGMIFSDKNMDMLLFERHMGAKVRRGGGKTQNPKKRTEEDDERLRTSLTNMIERKIK